MPEHFDVVVIGSGVGGGTLAYRLAPSGKRILILERGEPLPREKDNRDARAVRIDRRYERARPDATDAGNAFAPGVRCFVGGNIKVWGAPPCGGGPRTRSSGPVVRFRGGVSGLDACAVESSAGAW